MAGGPLDIQIFDESGTWVKPFGSTFLEVIVSGGKRERDVFLSKDFPSSVEIVISKETARFGLDVCVPGPGKAVKVISY